MSLVSGKMAIFDKTESLVMMSCAALSLLPLRQRKELPEVHSDGARCKTELPTRQSCPTRHAVTAAVKSELSDEKEQPESHANGAHDTTELPDETELPNEMELPDKTDLLNENGQRGEPSPQSVWGV